jgi:hypothetical protein
MVTCALVRARFNFARLVQRVTKDLKDTDNTKKQDKKS